MINNIAWLMDRFFQEYPHWKPANYEPFFDAYTYSSDEDTSSDYCTESDTDSEDDYSDLESDEEFAEGYLRFEDVE